MSPTPLETALGADRRAGELERIEARIRERDLAHINLQYTSVPGRIMGKVIPARHFRRIAENGLAWTYLSAGGFARSRKGDFIGPSGAAATEGLLIPDLGTFQVLPWDTSTARVFCDHYHPLDDRVHPGAAASGDCRANLKRVDQQFRNDHGLEVKSGCEPEMSWFPTREAVETDTSTLPGHISTAYHIGESERIRPILKQVTKYGQEMGLDMIQADYEDPGQIEMNFSYGSVVETADRLMTFRQICMQVASEFDVFATFMAKPVQGIMGNGCHHHLSLWKGDSPVLFGSDDPETREICHAAIGGLLSHSRGAAAICAPTVNSYARFWDTGLFAPTVPVWGYDNRQCIVRALPDRAEYRAPDATCNPYLTHAALITAMGDGIERRIDPGSPLGEDEGLPADTDTEFPLLPKTLGEAIDALDADSVVRSAFTRDILDTFGEIKRDEWYRACGAVTDWDREMYLNYLP